VNGPQNQNQNGPQNQTDPQGVNGADNETSLLVIVIAHGGFTSLFAGRPWLFLNQGQLVG
jgi:hypothetical protein